LVGLPCLFLLVLSFRQLTALSHEHHQARFSSDVVEISVLVSNMVQQFARERGLSQGVINGDNSLVSALSKQREKVDQAVIAFKSRVNEGVDGLDDQDLFRLLKPINRQLLNKKTIRNSVDGLYPDSEAFQYFSAINTSALNLVDVLIGRISNPDISTRLKALSSLWLLREAAGKERGVLFGVLTRQEASVSELYRVGRYVSDQNSQIARFDILSSEGDGAEFKEVLRSNSSNRVISIREAFMGQKNDLSRVAVAPANQWFEVASQRMGGISQFAKTQTDKVVQLALDVKDASFWGLVGLSSSVILICGAVILMSLVIGVSFSRRLNEIRHVVETLINEQDLRQRVKVNQLDELGVIGGAFNDLMHRLDEMVSDIKEVSGELSNKAIEFSNATQLNQKAVDQQHQETDLIASAVSQMAATSEEVAKNTENAADATRQARDHGTLGQGKVSETRQALQDLTREIKVSKKVVMDLVAGTDQIGSVLNTIGTIAEQTNLLALNAAIEASRAGDQGRGFAVVADEVRQLAQKTQESTAQIQATTLQLKAYADEATRSMEQSQTLSENSEQLFIDTEALIKGVFEMVENIDQLNLQISTAADQQTSVANEISENVVQVSQLAENTRNGAQVTQKGSEVLARIADHMVVMVQDYKVSD
jgi:methyl-accepting chemotaxis protein